MREKPQYQLATADQQYLTKKGRDDARQKKERDPTPPKIDSSIVSYLGLAPPTIGRAEL
jgi:hypothetical protein